MSDSNLPEMNAINFLGLISIQILCLIGFCFGIFNHWNVIVENWYWIGLFYFLIAVLIFIRGKPVASGNALEKLLSTRWALGLAVPPYVLVAVGFYEIYLIGSSPRLSDMFSLLIVGFVALALGAILFYFRLKWRFCYGVTEAIVGVVVASQRFYSDAIVGREVSTAPVLLAILTAGVYLVVRGADNMHQGLIKEPLDPIGQKVVEKLRKFGEGRLVQEIIATRWGRSYSSFVDRANRVGSVEKKAD